MTPREIQSAMKRLFYGDLPDADPWQHIFNDDGRMDKQKCIAVLNAYIDTPDVLLYGGTSETAFHCTIEEAPIQIENMLQERTGVRAATPDFKGRALFTAIGVATGRRRGMLHQR
jgi:hypothetical protein